MNLDERYKRNQKALLESEDAALKKKRVAVAGCGGLGGFVIENLARIGIGTIVAIDGDVFEPTNLNRQILSTQNNIGTSKAKAAAMRICDINSDVDVVVYDKYLTEENANELICGVDCVVDALDNIQARFWVAHACQTLRLPLVYGAIAGWFGQISTLFPGDVSFVDIYGASQSDGARDQGNLSFTAGAVGSFMASEVVKVLLGYPDVLRNRLLMIDMRYGVCESMDLT